RNQALGSFFETHREVDEEAFAAAMATAKFRADRNGQQLSPADIVRLGAQIYDAKREPAPAPPALDGVSPPSGGPSRPEPAHGKSWFESKYGTSPKEELREEEPDFEKMGEEYLDKKHTFLADNGLSSMVQQVIEQDENRRAPERKSLIPSV